MEHVSDEVIRLDRYQAVVDVMIRREFPDITEDLIPQVKARCHSAIAAGLKNWRKFKSHANAWVYTTLIYTIKDIRKNLREGTFTFSSTTLDTLAEVVYRKDSMDYLE